MTAIDFGSYLVKVLGDAVSTYPCSVIYPQQKLGGMLDSLFFRIGLESYQPKFPLIPLIPEGKSIVQVLIDFLSLIKIPSSDLIVAVPFTFSEKSIQILRASLVESKLSSSVDKIRICLDCYAQAIYAASHFDSLEFYLMDAGGCFIKLYEVSSRNRQITRIKVIRREQSGCYLSDAAFLRVLFEKYGNEFDNLNFDEILNQWEQLKLGKTSQLELSDENLLDIFMQNAKTANEMISDIGNLPIYLCGGLATVPHFVKLLSRKTTILPSPELATLKGCLLAHSYFAASTVSFFVDVKTPIILKGAPLKDSRHKLGKRNTTFDIKFYLDNDYAGKITIHFSKKQRQELFLVAIVCDFYLVFFIEGKRKWKSNLSLPIIYSTNPTPIEVSVLLFDSQN